MRACATLLVLTALTAPAMASDFFGQYSTGANCTGMEAEISRSRIAIGPFECEVAAIIGNAERIRIDGMDCTDEGDPAGSATMNAATINGKVYFSWGGEPDVRLYRCER